jgi:predicted enzyme related to lactoylglutathione lyase
MANNIPLIVFPAKDLAKTKSFFNTFLDAQPYAESEYYVGYKVGDLEVGLDPNGSAIISYIDTDDINSSLETLKYAGATVVSEPKDVGGGLQVAQVEIDGNVLGLRQRPQ